MSTDYERSVESVANQLMAAIRHVFPEIEVSRTDLGQIGIDNRVNGRSYTLQVEDVTEES